MLKNTLIWLLGAISLVLFMTTAGLMDERNRVTLVIDVIETDLIITQDSLASAKVRLAKVEAILLETVNTRLIWERKFHAVYNFLMVVDNAMIEITDAGVEYRNLYEGRNYGNSLEELDDTLKKYHKGIFGGRSRDTDLLINLKTRILIAETAEGVTK